MEKQVRLILEDILKYPFVKNSTLNQIKQILNDEDNFRENWKKFTTNISDISN
jgi:hypothetical protein